MWRPNYLSDTREILHNKIAFRDLSETVFRMTFPFLEAEITVAKKEVAQTTQLQVHAISRKIELANWGWS